MGVLKDTSTIEVTITELDRVDDKIPDFLTLHAPHTQTDHRHLEAIVERYCHFALALPLSSRLLFWSTAAATYALTDSVMPSVYGELYFRTRVIGPHYPEFSFSPFIFF